MYSISLFTTMALVLALMVSLNAPVVSTGDDFVASIVDTYDLLYNKGVEAYARQRWFECLTHLNGALTDYRVYRSTLITCKRECRKKSSFDDGALSTKPRMSEMQIFFRILKRSNCIRKCKRNHFGNRPDVLASRTVEEDFESRKPYDFLQYCHYKLDNIKEAVASSYTYLMGNPKHESTLKNLLFYQRLPGILEDHFIDMERKIYQSLFIKAQEYQMVENWKGVVDTIKPAVDDFIKEVDSCELLCEGSYDHEGFPQFINAVADHYIKVLKCQSGCEEKVSYLHGEKMEEFLAEMYNYLQFASYQLNNLDGAIKAVASFLLFKPEDMNMQENKRIYIARGASPDEIVPRPEAMDYYLRAKQRKSMLKFVKENYVYAFEEDNVESEDVSDPPPVEKELKANSNKTETNHVTSDNSDALSSPSDTPDTKSPPSDSDSEKSILSDTSSDPKKAQPSDTSSDSEKAPPSDTSSDTEKAPPSDTSSDTEKAPPSDTEKAPPSDTSSDTEKAPPSDTTSESKKSPPVDTAPVSKKSPPADTSADSKKSPQSDTSADSKKSSQSDTSSDSQTLKSKKANSDKPKSDAGKSKLPKSDSSESKSAKSNSVKTKSSPSKSNVKGSKKANSKTETAKAVKSDAPKSGKSKSKPTKAGVLATDIPKSAKSESEASPPLALSE